MAIQLFVPTFNVDDCLKEIRECLELGWTGMGYKTLQFEEDFKKYTGHKHAHFLNSATAGLYLAVEIFKEKYNWNDYDEIITTPITFVSTNHSIVLSKLTPVFTDVDDTLCLDPREVLKNITPRTKAIMYVGIGGNTGNLKEIIEICHQYKLKLILDAAHMAGTKYFEKTPGLNADVTVYSFQAVKNLPTSDSGMICFNDSDLDEVARKKAWLGINKDTFNRSSGGSNYKWYYDVEYFGNKYHGNSITASIGIAQLKTLNSDNNKRETIANLYYSELSKLEKISFVDFPHYCKSSRHLFQIIVPDRDALISYLNSNDVFPGVHYRNNLEYDLYSKFGNPCPRASRLSTQILSLPIHLRLTFDDVNFIISLIKKFMG